MMQDKYMLDAVAAEETALFYSSRESGRDLETGCIGHMRFDYGRDGKGFWSSWENHCASLKTQAFKDEFDEVVNHLRDNGIFKNHDTMQSYCRNNPQTKLNDGREYNHGFRIKTDSHVYYLRCITLNNDHSYIYAYERSRLEKCFPALADTALTDEIRSKLEKLAEYVIDFSTGETTTGSFYLYKDEIPTEIISQELYEKHINDFDDILQDYCAVNETMIIDDNVLDINLYLDYCPNYEPLPEEMDDYPPDRKILDPLTKHIPKPEKPIPATLTPKPTLTERIAKNKEKAAAQEKSAPHKPKKREELT